MLTQALVSRICIVSLICRHDQLIAHVIVADGFIIPYDLKSHPKLHDRSILAQPAPALNRNIPIRYDILGLEDLLEEGMAIHSSILDSRIPMDRGAWQATVHEVTKSQT